MRKSTSKNITKYTLCIDIFRGTKKFQRFPETHHLVADTFLFPPGY